MGETSNEAMVRSWQRSLHDKSPTTRKLYERSVWWFRDFLLTEDRPDGAVGDLLAVSRRDAEAWFDEQANAGLKPTTRRSRWIALRSFYGWLHEEEEIAINPMAKVKVEKPDPPPITLVGIDDLRKLLKVCEGKDFLARRDLAALRLLLAAGLRRAELVGLMVDDVDLDNRLVWVRKGKGDKARVGRFDRATAAALDRYVRARAQHRLAHLPNLWLSRLGPLTGSGLAQVVKARADEAGIGHLHAHQLRHVFADRAKTAGISDEALMHLGGWSDATVMRRYGSARAVDRALAAYDDFDPMADL